MEVRGRRVTVMGLGRHGGGVNAARRLAERGAVVTVTDLADEAALADSLAELRDTPIAHYRLGGHCDEDFRLAEFVVVNPAVKPGNPWIDIAAAAGATMTSEIELVLNACRARVVGVTGSNGKSTTAAMTAAILEADGRRVWLGGNLGGSLLGELEQMTISDWVVLELSSFQLARLSTSSRWPEAAIIVNCTPNHLDWHGDWQAYVGAKQRLLAGQTAESLAVLDARDPEVGRWQTRVRGRLLPPLDDQDVPPLAVPGEHNRRNAACAAAAATGLGCSPQSVERGLTAFCGLPHRLEVALEADGRTFYNDSMATTPESVMAAIDALGPCAWFLVGGYDKGVDYEGLIARLAAGGAARRSMAPCETSSWHWRRACRRVASFTRAKRCTKRLRGVGAVRKQVKRSCSRRHAQAMISFATIVIALERSSKRRMG